MLTRASIVLALAAFSTASIVVRHEMEACPASASPTRHCKQDTSVCCPSGWSCVTPSNGRETCLANSRDEPCPTGYGREGDDCILGAPGSGGSSSTSAGSGGSGTTSAGSGGSGSGGSGTGSASGSQTGAPTTTNAYETSFVTSSTVSTSESGSSSQTLPVPVTVPYTYGVGVSTLPDDSGVAYVIPTTSVSISTSYSGSGTGTVPVDVEVPVPSSYTAVVSDGTTSIYGQSGSSSGSVSYFPTVSTSGSVTIPITSSVTLTTSSDGSVGTAPPGDSASYTRSSVLTVVGAAALVLFML